MKLRAAILTVLALSGLPAEAIATTYCSGHIESMFTRDTGEVVIWPSFRGDFTTICAVSGTWNGIAASTCTTWVAEVQSALLTGRPVDIAYNTTAACNALPTYQSAPAPLYIMLKKQ